MIKTILRISQTRVLDVKLANHLLFVSKYNY